MALTAEQLAIRKKSIGGNDMAAICGINKYKSALDVYLDKTSEQIDTDTPSEAAHWGNVLEPVVADEYARRTGKTLHIDEEIIYHPEHNWMHANIDRWIGGKEAVLECKTTNQFLAKSWGDDPDHIPNEYLVQCAWYAAITKVEYVDVAVLIGGQDFRMYKYKRNLELEDKLIKIGKGFWYSYVLKDTQYLYPESKGNEAIADSEMAAQVVVLNRKQEEMKQLQKEINDLKIGIQSYMKEADCLRDDNGDTLATWRNTAGRSIFNTAEFKKECPEIYKKYTSIGKSHRRFLIK